MYPRKEILVFHVESSLHAGAGASVGHIDNPLQRERSTGNPIVQSNGVKGALREFFEEARDLSDAQKTDAVFGTADGNDGSGAVAFGEARLLFFPVRSLVGVFSYITCPSVIARFQRDLVACGKSSIFMESPDSASQPVIWDPNWVKRDKYLSHTKCMVNVPSNNRLVLEEIPFEKDGAKNIDGCLKVLAEDLFPAAGEYDHFRSEFPGRAVVLNDADYIHFVRYATEVEPHNRIGENGTVDEKTGVWYTEYLPSESILYTPLFIGRQRIRNGAVMEAEEVGKLISGVEGRRSWLGGDRTTGKGRVMMDRYGGDKKTSKTPKENATVRQPTTEGAAGGVKGSVAAAAAEGSHGKKGASQGASASGETVRHFSLPGGQPLSAIACRFESKSRVRWI